MNEHLKEAFPLLHAALEWDIGGGRHYDKIAEFQNRVEGAEVCSISGPPNYRSGDRKCNNCAYRTVDDSDYDDILVDCVKHPSSGGGYGMVCDDWGEGK